jgi:hypothetical protein
MATPTDTSKNVAVDAIATLASGGRVACYSATDVLLMTFTLQTPAFSAAVGGVASMTVPGLPIGNFVAAGTIDYVKLQTSLGADLVSFTAGLVASGEDVEFDDLNITAFSLGRLETFVLRGQ